MTTTPELHELATDPQAFDIVRARLTADRDKLAQEITQANTRLHELAGDCKSYRNTRVPVWGWSDLEVTRKAQRAAVHGDHLARVVLTSRAAAQAMAEAVTDELIRMDNAYTGWTRFFPSVTKSQPHIHRSLNCRTLHATTVMRWVPEMSGKTDEEAVAELDEALCTVCFPDAPVALHNYQSKRSQAERDERQAEKDARDAAKAVKTLDPQTEAFRTTGRFSDRITTVAACKDLIRKAVELAVEVDFWDTHSPAGWDADQLDRRRRNSLERLEEARKDAAEAERVLLARERAHPGHGADWDMIARMKASKEKSARKEWFK